MDVASKDDVNSVFDKPSFVGSSHAFPFHEMSLITVVERNMHKDYKPRSFLSVHLFKFMFQPMPLRCIFYCIAKGGE